MKEAQPEVNTKGAGKSCLPKPKSQAVKSIDPSHLLEEPWDDEEGSFEMVTNQLQQAPSNVQHLEARMLNLENALQRVIDHLEDQAMRHQGKPAAQ